MITLFIHYTAIYVVKLNNNYIRLKNLLITMKRLLKSSKVVNDKVIIKFIIIMWKEILERLINNKNS